MLIYTGNSDWLSKETDCLHHTNRQFFEIENYCPKKCHDFQLFMKSKIVEIFEAFPNTNQLVTTCTGRCGIFADKTLTLIIWFILSMKIHVVHYFMNYATIHELCHQMRFEADCAKSHHCQDCTDLMDNVQ